MSRLYGAKADSKRWEVVKLDDNYYNSYKLKDMEKKEVYRLNHVIGFEQVADDEFLIYRDNNDFEIVRYKLEKSRFIELFSAKFDQFHFITDDRILFTSWGKTGPYHWQGVYSIRDNQVLKDSFWLWNYPVEVYKDKENPSEVKLYIEEEFSSRKLGKQKLIFTVDPNTLEPNSDCYSQLRDSFIKVSSSQDVYNVECEEHEYIGIIQDQLEYQERKEFEKAKEKVLTTRFSK